MKNAIFLVLIILLSGAGQLLNAQIIPEAVGGFQWPLPGSLGGNPGFTNNGGATFGQQYYPCTSCCQVYHPAQDWNVTGTSCDGDLGTAVYAVATGKVVDVTYDWGGIVIQHNYRGQTCYSQYGHFLKASGITLNSIVTKGQLIGYVDDIGTDCAHLHMEIREADHPNPAYSDYWPCGTSGINSLANVNNWYDNPATFIPANGAYSSSLIAPAAGANMASGNIGFDWSDLTGATNYRIQITTSASGFSSANGFSSGLVVNTITNTTSSFSTNLSPGTYYWTVRGATNYETSPFAAYRTLIVGSSSGGGGNTFSCNNAIVLTNGVTYNGSTTGGTSAVSSYSCQSSWTESGPERVHSYSHSGGTITINLTQSSGADVDAFLLTSCSPGSCVMAVDMGAGATPATYQAGTYYIVVDGYNGAQGGYALTVTSSGGNTACNPPSANQIWASSITTSAAILNCNTSGVQQYDWQYKPSSGSTWFDLSATTGGSISLSGLTAGTAYQFRTAVRCGTSAWSNWSATASFTTLSAGGGNGGLSNDNCSGAVLLTVGSTCTQTYSTNVGATASSPSPSSNCPNGNYNDVWFRFVMPNAALPQVTIRTTAGTLTDAVMEVYSGSCTAPLYVSCEDDNTNGNGSTMPVINLSGGSGQTVWVRIWGYGGSFGTFTICVLNYTSSNLTDSDTPIISLDRDESSERNKVVFNIPPSSLSISPNPATDRVMITAVLSDYTRDAVLHIIDVNGRVVLNRPIRLQGDGILSEQFDTESFAQGIYVVNLETDDRVLTAKLVVTK